LVILSLLEKISRSPHSSSFKLHVCPTSRNKIKRRFSLIDQLDAAAHRSSRS